MVNKSELTPEALIQRDLQKLSDASALLMETLSNLGFTAGIREDPVKKLVDDMRAYQERIEDEIAKASREFIKHTFALEWFGRTPREPPLSRVAGETIARKLGIRYDGVQEGVGIQFTDIHETGTTFYGNSLEEARERLEWHRKQFRGG